MNEQEIKKNAQTIIEKSKFMNLGTISEDGFPHIRLVMNLKRKDYYPELSKIIEGYNEGFVTYISTNTSSNKVSQIKQNPNSSVYYELTEDIWQGLMLLGTLEIVQDMKIKRDFWQENWNMYYPQGVVDQDYTILRFKPKFLKLYKQLRTYNLKI